MTRSIWGTIFNTGGSRYHDDLLVSEIAFDDHLISAIVSRSVPLPRGLNDGDVSEALTRLLPLRSC
jgi:hypothetical protein